MIGYNTQLGDFQAVLQFRVNGQSELPKDVVPDSNTLMFQLPQQVQLKPTNSHGPSLTYSQHSAQATTDPQLQEESKEPLNYENYNQQDVIVQESQAEPRQSPPEQPPAML